MKEPTNAEEFIELLDELDIQTSITYSSLEKMSVEEIQDLFDSLLVVTGKKKKRAARKKVNELVYELDETL